ncbi:HAMP domain-containing histidine kinase [Candidatus Saccharibacteria bacterium]|nr:HAMP domain-containing histidine kinase [Candidatus Saccharibacteria bacterium]
MVKEVDGVMVVAHELKAPLAVLRQLALSFGELGAQDEHIRAEMISVSERAMRQVNDLTKIRKLDEGLFEMEPVAVRAVCDDVTHELQCLFKENCRELNIKYTNRAKLVNANWELLHSVVYNFLLNAMYYAEEGRAELTVGDTKGKVRIMIRDFGPALPIGIWREMKKGRIEQPVSIAMRPGSSGLGLYIASRFSRYMGATVGAVRHRDGASFYVELPVSKQASLF